MLRHRYYVTKWRANNISFFRDPILFPNFIHTQKRNPETHLKDPDMFWDFISLMPMTTHQVRNTPNSGSLIWWSEIWRIYLIHKMIGLTSKNIYLSRFHSFFLIEARPLVIDSWMGKRKDCLIQFPKLWCSSYGSHTFKMVNAGGEAVYCKFHYKSDQGIRTFTRQEADEMAKSDPDYAIRNLKSVSKRSGWYWHFQGPLQCHRLWRLPYLDYVYPGDDLQAGGTLGVQSIWSDKGKVWENIFS